ncbi:zinc finger protein 43-like [Sabethes cyaneus]|uniref:zinc finger protein 43-like n=1 Tax=Sabethes cyaneus TaxID=53552 RepID=UPI00237DBE4F|nr:zinc finger protein 43-like [Sabethes cyaneus]
MFLLDTVDTVLDGNIQDFISSITFKIEKSKEKFLPRKVCQRCLELLKFFAKFRSKLYTIQLLMDSLVELKLSNPEPIKNLFQTKSEQLTVLFKDLDLCTKNDALVDDLINEFHEYRIAKMGQRDTSEISFEKIVFEHNYFYAEECTTTELSELLIEPVENELEPVVEIAGHPEGDQSYNQDESDRVECKNPKKVRKRIRKYAGQRLAEPLQCSQCDYQSNYPARFEKHELSHSLRYECRHPGCSKVFLSCRSRSSHYSSCHKAVVCETCGKQFMSNASLTTHRERHQNLLQYGCSFCGKKHNTKQDLRLHINNRHNAAHFYSCETCGLQFKRKSVLNDHVLIHSNRRDYKCDKCDKAFVRPATLKLHRQTVHDKVRFTCELCDESYVRKLKLQDHMEYVHRIQCKFPCDVCLQIFRDQSSLDAHRARHDNPTDQECGVCLAGFPNDDEVKTHLCITYRDDYICCEKDFRYHYAYNKHMLLKHGIRTNVRVKPIPNVLLGEIRAKRKRIESCPKCETVFATRNQKKLHMEECTGPVETLDKLEEDDYLMDNL